MTMAFRARHRDGRLVSLSMDGADFDPMVTVSLDFFDGADSLFCVVDRARQQFTLYLDEGAATYEIIGAAPQPATVLAQLAHVIRPCPTCKLRAWTAGSPERHHWWCDRVAA